MKRLLITGGTAFVSRYAGAWFASRGYQVDVLNRGTRRQENGVRLIRADRHAIGDQLRHTHYDAVLDVTADIPQRSYFCFHDYAYRLDVTRQRAILPATVALEDGLAESFAWYLAHPGDANRRDDIGLIDRELAISR